MNPNEVSISSRQMYQIENNGYSLLGMHKSYMMENAGHGLADFIISKMGSSLSGKNIVSFCGTGNNGGDAIVASRHLAGHYGANVTVIILGNPVEISTEECSANWKIINKMKSIRIFSGTKVLETAAEEISNGDIIIDGIFGTGIKGNIRDPHSSAIDIINDSKAYVVSVDIPSGLNPDTGITHDKCVKADATVTFHRIKNGLIGRQEYTGHLHLEMIGIPIEAEDNVL
ncbi:MAG: NAD(P)H-hydrate epimerase [Thermoproteota archaeon]|nr:NAD(P)H-hydrate epimerase [Thermoproteota archaeon]